jgi:SAM-dependent methyltransferase
VTCPLCGGTGFEHVFRYSEPPVRENTFELGEQTYLRDIERCTTCGHFLNRHELDLTELYSGAYMDSAYADDRLAQTFERIMALPPERSDNRARVERVVAECGGSGTVLDVGSGLGVFPAGMKEAGWRVTALDPDPRAVAHAREQVGVNGVQADFMEADDLGSFDLVTLNKVLEHVEDPVAMLARTHAVLAESGTVYIELPDGEASARFGLEREEFYIEHIHVFSMASMCLLAQNAGFLVRTAWRLHEPSDKYTLVAFLEAAPDAAV